MSRKTSIIISLFAVAVCSLIFIISIRMQIPDKSGSEQVELPQIREPRIVVRKKDRLLDLYDGPRLIRSYKVVLGFAPTGDKEKEGDGRTPEGEFYLFTKNPKSRFHLSLGVSYPSKDDARRGLSAGIISRIEHDRIVAAIDRGKAPPQKTALGGEIYIHGGGIEGDWTLGCIAMKNEDIESLYDAIPVGASIIIVP